MKTASQRVWTRINASDEFDLSPVHRFLRRIHYEFRARKKAYPSTVPALRQSQLFRSWWYYSVELLPGAIVKGIYPEKLPFLPRILLRNCNLKGAECLDLGSMEGVIPTLMCRQGARAVLATDATYHCFEKLNAVKHYYGVKYSFQQVGLMYGLSRKIGSAGPNGFDLINLSGLLYHVYSPMHVLASVRPLLKKNGLLIVSTNVVDTNDYTMEFNNTGRLQSEENTFWYISIPLLEYLLRYFMLVPIDCLYLRNTPKDQARYAPGLETGYLSVVCRATTKAVNADVDNWMSRSRQSSWEYLNLCNAEEIATRPNSHIEYALDSRVAGSGAASIILSQAAKEKECTAEVSRHADSHTLMLQDFY